MIVAITFKEENQPVEYTGVKGFSEGILECVCMELSDNSVVMIPISNIFEINLKDEDE